MCYEFERHWFVSPHASFATGGNETTRAGPLAGQRFGVFEDDAVSVLVVSTNLHALRACFGASLACWTSNGIETNKISADERFLGGEGDRTLGENGTCAKPNFSQTVVGTNQFDSGDLVKLVIMEFA
jgi:hypothetical protein